MIRWGVLGTARTARKRMLPAILQAGHSIAAIAGRDPEKLAEFRRDFAIPTAYQDLDAVLHDSAVDAVYIPLPNSMHAEWAVRALGAGKRVLCEKPLALNLADADRVIAAARGGVLLENFCYKIRDGIVSPRAIDVHFAFQATEEHRPRFSRPLGGGSFLDLGCYGVDFAHRFLNREIEILDVRATRRIEWGDADESCLVQARSKGTSIQIRSSFAEPPLQEFALRFAGGSEERIQRDDDTVAMLQAFAQMRESSAPDLVRWRRNAAVYEEVLSRM